MNYINKERLCEDLMTRWEIADKEKEKEIQSIMADVVAPIVVGQPAADVRENKHGEWKTGNEDWGMYYCSHCRMEFVLLEGEPSDNGYNFCPNCGADMRGEQDE